MYRDHWAEIYFGPWVVTGNVAKVKVLHKLHSMIMTTGCPISILDIGCVGVKPFEFWEPLLTLIETRGRFYLTGLDVQGIKPAEAVLERRGWKDQVSLKDGTAYDLHKLFAPQSFEVVVATQVLEHIARISRFADEVNAVLKPGGHCFFTLDSAHWEPRFDFRDPIRLTKNLVKKMLSLVGNEKHYDLPWYDHEVAAAFKEVGLELHETRYYNLDPLKCLHNHTMPVARKNSFMEIWFDLEELLNEEQSVRENVKPNCRGLYLHFRKPLFTGRVKPGRKA